MTSKSSTSDKFVANRNDWLAVEQFARPSPLVDTKCRLAGWKHECAEGRQHHHLVNKSKLPNNYYVRKFVEKTHREVFLVPVCGFANRSRLADSKAAQAKLLQQQLDLFGEEYVRDVWDEFLDLLKEPDDLTIDAILAKQSRLE